jgi:hypothetical protein
MRCCSSLLRAFRVSSTRLRARFSFMDGEAFFRQLDDGLYEATEWTRGPWNPKHQHAGPPSALVCGRLEEIAGDALRVVRVAIEIPRPVPIARLRLETSVRRSGRSVTAIVGQLFDQEGKLVMKAEALALSRAEIGIPAPRPQMDELLPSESSPIEFPFHDSKPGYAAGMELRFARGTFGKGDVMAWMRMRLPLLSDADLSPLERTLIAADSGNGVSQRVSPFEYTFLNADLTVTLHHPAEGEWIGMAARTDFDIDGVGVADTRLYDARGPIGRGIQTLLIRKR